MDRPVPADTHLDRYEVHKRVRDRLSRRAFVTLVETEPSPMRPIRVRATLDTRALFDDGYRPTEATLEFEWRPRPALDHVRIQYLEPDAAWSCGWHQDGSHEDLGPNHFQVDHREWDEPYREPGPFDDPNPMAILERCLEELLERVPTLPESVA